MEIHTWQRRRNRHRYAHVDQLFSEPELECHRRGERRQRNADRQRRSHGCGAIASGTLSGGTATLTIPAYSLTAGNDTLTAHYSGDATYAKSSGTAAISVAKATPTVTFQPSPTHIAANDANDNIVVVVSGGGTTPTGTVTVSVNSYVSYPYTLYSGTCTIFIPVSDFVNGTNTITASYSGDAEYLSGTGTTTVTATILTPTLQLVPSATSLSTADNMTLTVNVTGTGGTPTGSVSLQNIFYDYGTLSTGGSFTFNIGPDTLAPGTDTLTVQYLGDSTYLAKSASVSVNVSISPASVTVTPSATSIYTNNTLTLTGSVTSTGGTPTGELTIVGGGSAVYTFLSGGQYTAVFPAGWLSAGTDTITVNYSGDMFYSPASTSTTVTVTQFVKITPTVTVTPASNAINTGQPLSVTISVTGTGGPATGTVTLTSGSYNSGPMAFSGGSATVCRAVEYVKRGDGDSQCEL